jgi:glutathione S-transferase
MKLDVWGAEASPYLLKVEALLNYRGDPFRRLPRDGGRLENIAAAVRLGRARRRRAVLRYPALDPLDEYPSVPYLIVDGRRFLYDSSAIALWLDDQLPSAAPPFYPEDRVLRFVASLIDEAFDEYGLYMVHHQRWVCSATDNIMGETTAREFSRLLLPPFSSRLRVALPRRQVRRCPYLFSVARPGYQSPVEAQLVPPSRPGFPPTHDLLENTWLTYLAAVEQLLAEQSYILGGRFTVADAAAYGQLSMNLIDPTTAANLERLAPRAYRWLLDIRDGRHRGSAGGLVLSPALQPLLDIIMKTFAPLMVQNERAYRRFAGAGETLFNEAAFDRGNALYQGELMGCPFRSVAKTFQVVVWRELCAQWQQLEGAADALAAILPDAALLDGDESLQSARSQTGPGDAGSISPDYDARRL